MAVLTKKMDILIVGGTGVLSSVVCKEAMERKMNVTLVNRGNRMNMIPQGAFLIKSNKDDYENIKGCIGEKKYDAVIDFLCFNEEDIIKSFGFYKDYTKQYFFISSCAVYDTRKGGIMREDSEKVLPLWKYSVNKWKCEQLLAKLAYDSSTKFTVIRPAVTYGNTRIPYGVAPEYGYHWTIIERAKHSKPIIRWNKGNNICNMTRVEDFAIGVVGLVGNEKAYNEAFNVCGDETPSFNNVIDSISKYLKIEIPTIDIDSEFYAKELSDPGELLLGRAVDSVNSNEKLRRAVPEFKQNIPLEEGVSMTLQSYIDNHYERGISWSFDAECDRVISLWCKKNKLDRNQYNIGFIDYFGSATMLDKYQYWMTFHKHSPFAKILSLLYKVFFKLKSLI